VQKQHVLDRIRSTGLIPVIRARSADEANRAVDAIQAGGVGVLEITMTVPGAVDLIREVAARATDAVVGAGTVLDPQTAIRCIDAGAQFILSPALNPATIATCRERDVAIIPGALTPTEVVAAWTAGADLVKVFPAGSVGGPDYLKALKAPLPEIDLVPTGGVNLETAGDFIRAGAAALGVGSALVDLAALRRGEASVLTERARRFVEIVQAAREAG
jgi:2-dehydro-3-deoxyphosphogluconate aldolase/(4S)-4-hydroxy-2-oxoglutarate aldolase